ncbi:MAG: ATP-binding protein, partial [Thiohalomonadaceae bacterium]
RDAMDEILVLVDPNTGAPFVEGLEVKVDYQSVQVAEGSLDVRRGEPCATCFANRIPLYSRDGSELLGIATYRSSNAFFEQVREEVRSRLLVVALAALGLLVLGWRVVSDLFQSVKSSEEATSNAMRVKSNFLATMSHEIRTPMNGVLGMVYLLRDTRLSRKQREYVDTIAASGEALLVILDDVLDLSKIEAGKLVLEKRPMELRRILEDIMLLNSALAKEKSLELTLKVDPKVPEWVFGDPVRLRQVLQNLVGNAVKFTTEGRVDLSVQVEDHEPGSSLCQLLFSVQDTGIGISPADRSRLFTDFSQADSSISRKFGGTGLGLAICKRLVSAMGGSIDVESQPGIGSRFFFVLTVQPTTAPAKADTEPLSSTGKQHSLRILVAEDGEINRRVVRMLLQKKGHAVLEAENGREAVERLMAEDVDVVLMDVQMPEVDGLEATRRIRRLNDPAKAGVPIVALTANALPEEQQAFSAAGMDAHVSKPLRPDELYRVLARFAERRPTRSAPGSLSDLGARSEQGG